MNNISFKGVTVDAKRQITHEYPKCPRDKHFAAKVVTCDAFILEDENQTQQKRQVDIDYSPENDYFVTTRPKSSAKKESKVVAKNFKTIDEVINYLRETTIKNCRTVQAKAHEEMDKIDNPRKKHGQYGHFRGIAGSMETAIARMNGSYEFWLQKTAGQKPQETSSKKPVSDEENIDFNA